MDTNVAWKKLKGVQFGEKKLVDRHSRLMMAEEEMKEALRLSCDTCVRSKRCEEFLFRSSAVVAN